ncbi:hypothetical protein EDB83DRAFT_2417018 [Lactarius deliciosus]|nr:hypothetical protein EDB83DRAFT_2417018 [Lactarius deliciosus]
MNGLKMIPLPVMRPMRTWPLYHTLPRTFWRHTNSAQVPWCPLATFGTGFSPSVEMIEPQDEVGIFPTQPSFKVANTHSLIVSWHSFPSHQPTMFATTLRTTILKARSPPLLVPTARTASNLKGFPTRFPARGFDYGYGPFVEIVITYERTYMIVVRLIALSSVLCELEREFCDPLTVHTVPRLCRPSNRVKADNPFCFVVHGAPRQPYAFFRSRVSA